MINILTGTPFASVPRLHHREDELSLEGDSSAGSHMWLLAMRGVMMAAIQGGEDMQILTSAITRNTTTSTSYPNAWINEAFGDLPRQCMLVRKTILPSSPYYCALIIFVKADGSLPVFCMRNLSNSAFKPGTGNTSNQVAHIYEGDEYIVVPLDYSPDYNG